jgi:enoyl-CoA hydratase/carnithine racemase
VGNPAPALRWIKQLLTQNANETDTMAAQIREATLLRGAYASPEHQEAVAAFLERRAPSRG